MTKDQALEALGVSPETHTYRQGYNRYWYLAKKHHPDRGGDVEQCKVTQTAWEIVKPLLPKSLPPVAYLIHHSGEVYNRWVGVWKIDEKPEDFGYFTWISYCKQEDVYVCIDHLKKWLPDSEIQLEAGRTHRIRFLEQPTEYGKTPSLRVKETEPKKFAVERYE